MNRSGFGSRTQRAQRAYGGAGHDALEGFLEALHLRLRADGDADVRGPYGPGAADENILGGHRGDDFFCGALGVQHEAIGLRRNVGIAVLREPLKGGFTDRGVDVLALGDEPRILQTCGGRCHGGDGHGAPTRERPHFLEKLWPADGKAAAKPGHSVNF